MYKILSVNAGSSSLKFKLINMPKETVITEGVIERIGFDDALFSIKFSGNKVKEELKIDNHEVAVDLLISKLTDLKIIDRLDEIRGVGHRVVHGGERFKDSVVITDEVINDINELSDLAPLHNPANITGIKAFKKFLPSIINVAVFDTSFHQTMSKEAYLYGTPYSWYEDYGIRKYGFHGTSHKYVSTRMREILKKDDAKVIVCHLGNGASICAVDGEESIDTSMGFTPLAGLVMGTRSGDIDPALIPFVMEKTGMSINEIETQLNKKSGLLGVSGRSSDSRDIEEGILSGDERSALAQNIFTRRVVSYIASYHVLLGGADAIVFTAGIGENSILTRKNIIDRLGALGVYLDEEANNVRGKEQEISTTNSKIKSFIIPTNEELVIARDVMRLGNLK